LNTTSYPALLQEHPGFRHFSVRNFGVGGTTAIRASNQSFWSTEAFQESLKCGPDIVILQLGTNDAKVRYWNITLYQEDYKALATLYKTLPSKPIVLLCIPPPLYSNASLIFQPQVLNDAIPKIVPSLAAETGSILVDNFAALGGSGLKHPQYFLNSSQPIEWSKNDGIHPNDLGYKAIANNVAVILRDYFSTHPRPKSKVVGTPAPSHQ
jgi:lysophospholipase L1-like esterase